MEREREVRATGAEVDDPQAPFRQRRDDVVDQLDEAVDLPELRPPLRADAAVRGLDAERDEERDGLPFGQRVALGAVVGARRLVAASVAAQDARLAAAGEDLPVGVGLVEERLAVAPADSGAKKATSAGPSTFSSVVRAS